MSFEQKLEELKKDNYILSQKGSDLQFEMMLDGMPVATLTIQYENKIPIGTASIKDDKYIFSPISGKWPRKFIVTKNNTADQNIMKFSLLGFSGKITLNGIDYKLSVDTGVGVASHNVWQWCHADGSNRTLDLKYTGATHPEGIQTVSIDEVESCPEGILLPLLAQYLIIAHVRGRGFFI